MGVRNLYKYFLNHIPKNSNIIKKIYLKDLINKTIVIDSSIYIYKFFSNDGNYDNLKYNIDEMINAFLSYKITPIYVFDGKPNKLKNEKINNRNKEYIENNTFYKPNKETFDFVKNILRSKNITYYEDIEQEADIICAWLVKTKKAWACLSDDTDLFVYGCPRILRCYSNKTKSFMLHDLNKILNNLNLDLNELREICAVSYNDYNIKNNINIEESFNLFYKYIKSNDNNKQFIEWLIDNNYIEYDKKYYEILELTNIDNDTFYTM